MFFSGEGGIIKAIMQDKAVLEVGQMITFVGVWYLFTIITYGTNVPAGLFLPGMIIGCCVGELFYRLFVSSDSRILT